MMTLLASQIKQNNALKYMINRLWHGIFHITCHINPRLILALGFIFLQKMSYKSIIIQVLDRIYRLIYVNVHFGVLHIVLSFSSSNKQEPLYVNVSINCQICVMLWECLAKLVMILCSICCECVLQPIGHND